MTERKLLPRAMMLGVAIAQGFLLFALYKTVDLDLWPSQSPVWSFPLWTVTIVFPLLFLLSVEIGNERRVLSYSVVFTAFLAVPAFYTGWQSQPYGEFPLASIASVFCLSISIACFKALMYLQQRASGLPLSYELLFTYSWRNFLVLALAGLFVLIFWGILWLWAGLFIVIEIDFFSELFKKDWFIFPILGLSSGLGIIIFRELTSVIDNITKLLRGLIKLLLPLVVIISVIFLAALPFSGLEVLWATGSGTSLLLWLTALILFFTNAVYQDGRGSAPYPDVVHRLLYAGLFVLPVTCALSFYGLWLRLDQHGWTVLRSWGFVVWLILALFSVGYTWGIFKRGDAWPSALARVNIHMGWAIVVIMILANSPLLDFRKISLADQLNRVDDGEVNWSDFDFFYVRQQLGRPGYLAMETLKARIGDSDPELLALIENPTPNRFIADEADKQLFWDNVVLRPAGMELPVALRQQIERGSLVGRAAVTVIVRVDLNGDGVFEYATFERDYLYMGRLYSLNNGLWEERSISVNRSESQSVDAPLELTEGAVRVVDPLFKDMQIGDLHFQVN